MPNNNLSKSKQKEIKDLIEKGRQEGFLTIGEINDLLPTNLYDADQIDGIIKLITDLKIKVVESNKDVNTEVVIGDDEVSDDRETVGHDAYGGEDTMAEEAHDKVDNFGDNLDDIANNVLFLTVEHVEEHVHEIHYLGEDKQDHLWKLVYGKLHSSGGFFAPLCKVEEQWRFVEPGHQGI